MLTGKLRLLMISLCSLITPLITNAQLNDAELKLFKLMGKNYRSSPEIINFCEDNFAIIYLNIKNNKVDSLSSNTTLGNLIIREMNFLKNYEINGIISKPKIGVFIIIKNFDSFCLNYNKNYNENAIIAENIFKEIGKNNKQGDVNYIFTPFVITNNEPIR
jgi:hypothetical protein